MPDPGGLREDYLARRWETGDGLPENSATTLAQTRDGYLWFGTFNGLVRFDGAKFTTLTPATTPELPSEGVVNLHVDESGRLWVSTLRGLAVLTKGRWTQLTSTNVSLKNFARTISDRAGKICVTTYDGRVLQGDERGFEELPEPPGFRGNGYFGYLDRTGTIWVGQSHFFGRWDGQRWVASELSSTVTAGFGGMGAGRNGDLWVVSGRNLLRIKDDRLLSELDLGSNPGAMWQVYEDRQSTVWLCTQEKGLYVATVEGRVKQVTATNGLPANSIRSALQDMEGNVWLGTSGEGLMALTPRRFREQDLGVVAPVKRITALLEESPGRMLVGAYGKGLAVLEGNQASPVTVKMPALRDTNGSFFVQSVWRDSTSNLWLGTYHDGVLVVRPDGVGQRVPPTNSGGLDAAAIFGDSRGRIWIGGDEAVARVEDGQFHVFGSGSGLAMGHVRSFAEDRVEGRIWAGGPEGVFRYEAGRWTELKDNAGRSLKETICVRVEVDGTLWIGGSIMPLYRYRQGRLVALPEGSGLAVRVISSMVDDGLGYWWLGSNRGIARVARADLEAVMDGRGPRPLVSQLFTMSDGLPSVECVAGFQSTAVRDANGRLWFATLKGLVTFDPAALQLNTNPPPVYLEEFQVEDQAGRWTDGLPDENGLILVPPGRRELAASFTAPSYMAPEKMRFAYRVDGLHDDWIEIGNRRAVQFFPPPPGRYRLWVKAANNDGLWNEAGVSMGFEVQPFFWQTLWFRGLLLGGLVGGTGLIFWQAGRGRLRRKVREYEHRMLVEKERLRLAGILDATSDLVGFADRTGRVLFLNAAGRRLLGLTETEDVSGLKLRDLHPPRVAAQIEQEGLPTATRSGSWSAETALQPRGGPEIPVSQVLLVRKTADGQIDWISTIARDVTERRKAEEALRISEEKFSRSFRWSPVPIAVSRRDNGVIIEVNEALERLTGYRRDELVGRNTIELGFWTDVEERRRQLDALSAQGFIRGREMKFRSRDGREVVSQYAAELIEMGGERCVLTVLADITERKSMEEFLQASETLLRQFIEHAPAAVAMFDRDMKFLQVSSRWLADYHLEGRDVIGRPYYEIIPNVPERWKASHRRALAGAVESCEEEPYEWADGSMDWLQLEIRPWRTAGGEIGGIIIFSQIITERKQTLQQVQSQLAELQRWHRLTLEREDRVLQLKAEINELCRRHGESSRYPSALRVDEFSPAADRTNGAGHRP